MFARSTWRRASRSIRSLLALLLVLTVTPVGVTAQADDAGATTLTGTVRIEPDELATYSQPYVLLYDQSTRGRTAVPDPASQVAAALVRDGSDWSFTLSLPVAPIGTPINLVGPDTAEMPLVYSVEVTTNMTGTPFLEEADFWGGNLNLFSSIDVMGDGITGQFVVWSDGDGAEFPSEPGRDGAALTNDDPMEELEAGWTVIDVTEDPYLFDRDAGTEISFPADSISPNDLSYLDYSESFDALVDQLELEYAFTDVKDVDFDALREEFGPMVETAEADDDREAFSTALYLFALAFDDGHVNASRPNAWLGDNYGGSFGFTLGQTDDGALYVIDIADDGPAEEAGIEPGDELTLWNEDSVGDAIDAVVVPRSLSSDFDRERKQVRWLSRAPVGTIIDVTLAGPDGESDTVELTAVGDRAGLMAAAEPTTPWNVGGQPITSEVLPSGVGYIRITTFDVDLVLFTHAWDYALRNFAELGVTELIVDVRSNYGGFSPLSIYATASFVEDDFLIDQGVYPDGDGGYQIAFDEYAIAGPDTWDGPVAVLVDEDCISTCELFAGTMAAIERDDISLVGYTPTAGIYAAVQFWDLPDGLYFQASAVRFDRDGEVYLEGTGAELDLDVPVTRATLLSDGDPVLDAAVGLLEN